MILMKLDLLKFVHGIKKNNQGFSLQNNYYIFCGSYTPTGDSPIVPGEPRGITLFCYVDVRLRSHRGEQYPYWVGRIKVPVRYGNNPECLMEMIAVKGNRPSLLL